jgi:Cd2+/Zn2+-exporting ATPase
LRERAPCPGCEGERTEVFLIEGLDCAAEAAIVERSLLGLPGVCSVRTAPASRRATVVHTLPAGSVEAALASSGFVAREATAGVPPSRPSVRDTAAAAALTAAGVAAGALGSPWGRGFLLAAVVVGGLPIARKALARARAGSLDMNALMTIAVVGAVAIGEWSEAAVTVVLFSLAHLLEGRSLDRVRQAISGLMSAPDTARVSRDGREERIAATEVRTGDEVIVGPGERIPVDGRVIEGTSAVDESPLTGESAPVDKGPGHEVFAGSINAWGTLAVRVSRAASETTLARVIRRVEEAQASRAPSQGFVERFARIYTPVVVLLAAVVSVVPTLLGHGDLQGWIYHGLVLLVISCPCALVISTPVSIVSALTSASRRGVLVKGGAHLETMGRLRGVVFDKTGTLTVGAPVVEEIVSADGVVDGAALRLAAALEARSGHPLAAAIAERARDEGVAASSASDVTELPGRGLRGVVEGRPVLVGSHRLFDERGLCNHRLDAALERIEQGGRTAVLVGYDGPGGGVAGTLAVADGVRPGAARAVSELRAAGIHVAMLTGDNSRTARAVAGKLGIEDWSSDLLPEEKVDRVAALVRSHGPVAMVGDGVNDAPALAAASVGIAMGRRGTDATLETADVVLMSEDLERIPETVRLGRTTLRVIGQNVALALLVKAAVLALALAGQGTLWAAVAADTGASLLVVGNGLRLLKR